MAGNTVLPNHIQTFQIFGLLSHQVMLEEMVYICKQM